MDVMNFSAELIMLWQVGSCEVRATQYEGQFLSEQIHLCWLR